MTPCVVCFRLCTPMADYDVPVCHRCDAASEDRRWAFLTTPRGRGLPQWAADLPPSYRTGPGDPDDIAELIAAFDSRPGRRVRVPVGVGRQTE